MGISKCDRRWKRQFGAMFFQTSKILNPLAQGPNQTRMTKLAKQVEREFAQVEKGVVEIVRKLQKANKPLKKRP